VNTPYLTVDQAVGYTHLSRWTLRRAVRDDKLREYGTAGRVLYKQADLDHLLEQRAHDRNGSR
jgi:excisionase family DNA binding protein